MTCQHSHSDGAYVLGALSPVERGDFEQHLGGCERCARSVQRMAGLPGLLARVDGSVLESPSLAQGRPETLLPALVDRVHRSRRRRTVVTAALASAAASAIVIGSMAVTGALTDETPLTSPRATTSPGPTITTAPTSPKTEPAQSPSPSGTAPSPSPKPLTMATIGNAPVRGLLSLESVAWGTRLGLTCSYGTSHEGHGGHEEYDEGTPRSYAMFVRTRDGHVEQVASWQAVPGRTMHLVAATASVRTDITQVEVRTDTGQPVLRLAG